MYVCVLQATMNQRIHFYQSVSLENSIKQLEHRLALAIREIKNSACGLVLYFMYSTRGNALTYTYIYIHTHIYIYIY